MQNSVKSHNATDTELAPGTRQYAIIRKAYMEILLDLPGEYDCPWGQLLGFRGANIAIAEQNYEMTREACLHLALEGRLPDWRNGQPIPECLRAMVRRNNQERRLGRELNLTLSLAATPRETLDLGQTY